MKLCLIFLSFAVFLFSCGEDGKAGADGAEGANASLLNVTTEAEETENCDGNGGTKLDAGIDENNNGVLDDDEIDSTQFICNGASGENGSEGTDGENSLINITDEPEETENCDGNGGKKVESGIDANADGTLDPEEVKTVKYICNDADMVTYYGDFYVSSLADITTLSKYNMVVGSVYINSEVYDTASNTLVTELSLPNLKQISQSIYFGNMQYDNKKNRDIDISSSFEKIELPNLESVHGLLYVSFMNSLESISFPELKEVGISVGRKKISAYEEHGLSIMYNTLIKSISVPKLEKGTVYISDNDSLESIDLSGMKTAETSNIDINYNELLTSLNLSNLETILSINLENLPELTILDLSNLKGSTLTLIYIDELSKLTELNFSALQKASSIYIEDMDILTSTSLPELISVNDFEFTYNSELASITAPKLISIEYFEFGNNDKLETIALPEVISINEMDISNNPLLTSFNMPKLETAGSSYFRIYNNESLSECTLLDFINTLTVIPELNNVSGNKSCKCYEYNSAETDDYSNYEDFSGFMGSGSWSIAEKMIIPATGTEVVYPHLYRGIEGSPAKGDFKVSVDGVNHTILASLYDGTTWKELSGTDDKIKPSAILSIILNYDVSTTTFSLYLNGTMIDSDNTVTAIDDTSNSSLFYVAASNDGTNMTNYVPYIFLHHKLIQRALTEVEITAYTEATSDLIPVIDAENAETNFMDGAMINTIGSFTTSGAPVQKSVLDIAPASL